jgi:ribonuclease P protein component
MLPSRERLTRSSLFQRAYTARKSISSPLVTLYVVPRFKQPGARSEGAASKHSENASEMAVKQKSADRMPLVGFVVAKKVCKSACVRNRAKRRLREAYRLLRSSEQPYEELALSQWYALVWVVHDKALAASWEEIQQTVSQSLAKAHTRFGNSSKGSRPSSATPDSHKNPQGGPGPGQGKDCKLS